MALIQSGSVQSIISIPVHAKNGLTKLINDYQCYDIIKLILISLQNVTKQQQNPKLS